MFKQAFDFGIGLIPVFGDFKRALETAVTPIL